MSPNSMVNQKRGKDKLKVVITPKPKFFENEQGYKKH